MLRLNPAWFINEFINGVLTAAKFEEDVVKDCEAEDVGLDVYVLEAFEEVAEGGDFWDEAVGEGLNQAVGALEHLMPEEGRYEGVDPANWKRKLVTLPATTATPKDRTSTYGLVSVWGKALQIFLLAEAPAKLPFLLKDASRPVDLLPKEGEQFVTVGTNTRLDNRVLDLRTPVNQAIFRVQSRVCNLFRRFLDDEGFIEIHTPKIQGAATESGASVFKLGYFERTAFLA
ncbi:hypothetical protein PtB15_4B383 [Puccinia triticina]|nr:hypothetical protein PtB15_4B383 [Puccinia triticina]